MADPDGLEDGKSERILVVEPDPVVREVLREDLGDMGHHVEATASTTAALRALARRTFDIVFVNIGSARPGARVVLAAGRSWLPDLSCVILVPFGDGPELTAALSLNPLACLRVPFSAAELESVTRLAARHAHAGQPAATPGPSRGADGKQRSGSARRGAEDSPARQDAGVREKV